MDFPQNIMAAHEKDGRTMQHLTLQHACKDDIDFVFALANDSDVRKMSFNSEKISWKTHQSWFTHQLNEKNPFYIVFVDDIPCAYVRMQKNAYIPIEDYVVSIAVHPVYRRNGIATEALHQACTQVLASTWVKKVWAIVKNENKISLKMFIKASFKKLDTCVIYGHTAVRLVYP